VAAEQSGSAPTVTTLPNRHNLHAQTVRSDPDFYHQPQIDASNPGRHFCETTATGWERGLHWQMFEK